MPSTVIESPQLLSLKRRTISLEDALTELSTHDRSTADLAAGDNWDLGEGLGLLLLATPSRSSQHTRLIWSRIRELAGSILPTTVALIALMFQECVLCEKTLVVAYCCLDLLDVNKHKNLCIVRTVKHVG